MMVRSFKRGDGDTGAEAVTVARGGCPLHAMLGVTRGADGPGRGGITAGGMMIFAYGLLAYAAFFGTILYAIGFVGNWLVPKSIDSGAGAGYAEAILVNGGILVLFVAQHTVMARSWFKAWWTRIIPATIERSTFVLLASAILMVLFWQWRPLPGVVWSVEHPAAVYGLNAVSLAGWVVVFASSFMVSHFDLFGLRQSLFGLLGLRYRPVGFRLVGLYKLVRHPLMVGFLIAFWSVPTMTEGRLLFAALTTGYIFFGTWIEERSLIADHGEAYESYRRRVRGFIPIPRSAQVEQGAA